MSEQKYVIVETALGPVRGVQRKSYFGDTFFSFQKIPYAQPPIGELRFRDPLPPKPWTTPLDATKPGPSCYGVNTFTTTDNQFSDFSEDALHVMVYTTNLKPKKPRAVMVWIHGGAFCMGSGGEMFHSPDYLLKKDIVLISMNYRLGAFGFLSIDKPSLKVPGNAGLKDQTMALQWVKKNCSYFGGDTENITIFGESAGGVSVHYHCVTNMSMGLFNKAIIMSGSVFNPWACLKRRDYFERLAQALGWQRPSSADESDNDLDEAFAVIKNSSADAINKAQGNLLTDEDNKNGKLFAFGPVIEPYVSEQSFIPKEPKLMCREAWSKNMPIMIGGTSEEGLFAYKNAMQTNSETFDKLGDFEYIVPVEISQHRNIGECKTLGKRLREFYYDDKIPSRENISIFTDLMSDKLFWHGLHRAILSRNSIPNSGPTYLYRFNYDSPTFNHVRMILCQDKNVRGACHGDDLSYLFKNLMVTEIIMNSDEYKTINRMVDMWTQFAENGNPNCAETKHLLWKPVESQPPFTCMNISNELTVISLPETKRLATWDLLYHEGELY